MVGSISAVLGVGEFGETISIRIRTPQIYHVHQLIDMMWALITLQT